MTHTAFSFPKLQTLKTWLDKCLKSPFSEDPSTSNMVNVPKHCSNLHHITFIILMFTAKSIELEKVALFDMTNLGTAC